MLYTRADGRTHVSAAVPATLNFQARLLQSNGSITPDGNYSVEFNLYTASSGGASAWTETQATVPVKSGYLSVYLGDVNNTLGSLDWSQQYWLTMNVNGDGEMNPRLRLTSVPYAFRSSQADGITNGSGVLDANDIVQLTPSSVQAVNTALAALRINQTGAGLLAQLQGNGADVFTVEKDGDVTSAGSATFNGGTLNLGAAAQAGGLVLSDGSSNTGTVNTEALGQNTTYNLPDPGTASVDICLSTGNCGGSGDISQGGNSFGADMTIGTNDGNNLNFETAGLARLALDQSGNANLTGALTTGTGLTVTSGGAAITGNSTIAGSLTGLTGLTSSGTVVFSGLTAGRLVATTTGGQLTNSITSANLAASVTNETGTGLLVFGTSPAFTTSITTASTTFALLNTGATTINAFGAATALNLGAVTGSTTIRNALDVAGAITAGTADAFQVSSAGAVTAVGVDAGTGILQGTGGLTITGNSSITGTLGGLTGLASSGTVTFSGLGAGLVQSSSGGALSSGVVDRNSATFFNNALSVSNGGTGTGSFTTNGLLYGNGTGVLQAAAAGTSGQILIADSSGIPTFRTLTGDASISDTGVVSITSIPNDSVVLGTDTTGNYVQNLGTLTGLSTSGNSGEGSTPSLSVLYGATANTAVQGSTTLVCPSGTGNLSGGGNTITLGTGGSCNNLATNNAVSFTTSVTTPLLTSSGVLTLQTQATGGADDLVFQTAGTEKMRLLENGNLLFEKGANDVAFVIDTPGAAATYTFSGASGTVLTTANFASGGLDSAYVNVGESPAAGDINGSFSGGLTINANSVALGTDTVGDYIQNLGSLTGLSTSGNSGEGSTPGLSVLYGATANTAVQGSITLICPSGSGNLSGGGNTITLGTGGSCGSISTNNAVTFSTSVTTPILTSSGGLLLSSGGSGDITLDSASNTIVIDATDTTLQRTAAGSFTLNLSDGAATTLVLNNSGAGAASLNLQDGGLQVAGTSVITNGRALQNLTGISSSGTISFSTLSAGGMVKADGSGNLLIATPGTDYEVPLGFANGLSRTGNAVGLGGPLLTNTSIDFNTRTLSFTGTGSVGIGTTADPNYRLTLSGGNLGLQVINNSYSVFSSTTAGTYGFVRSVVSSDSVGHFEVGAYDVSGASQGGRPLVLNPLGGNVSVGTDTTPDGLFSVGSASQFQVNGSGAVTTTGVTSSGLVTISAGGANITGSTSITGTLGVSNTLTVSSGGLIVSAGGASISGGLNNNSGGITNGGAVSGVTTLSLSGAISGATATNTINGLIINSGSLSGITGFSQTSGAHSITGTGAITIGGGSNALTINSTNFDVSSAGALSGITTISASGNINTTGIYQISGTNGFTGSCGGTTYARSLVSEGGLVTGFVCASIGLSDERLKENITSLDGSITDKIKQINTVNFDFDCSNPYFEQTNTSCDGESQTGVIAQELAEIFPELVYQDEYGYYRVKYEALNIYNLKAVGEIAKTVDSNQNVSANTVKTGEVLRISSEGVLQNITGLNLISGGASVIGGIDNNSGGLSETGSISGATTIDAQRLTLNASGINNLLELKKDNKGVFTVFNNGALELRLDSATGFVVRDAAGISIFTIDTINGQIRIGAGDDSKTVLFTLDSKSDSIDDPPGVNGASYYNDKLERFRCYQGNRWIDCLPIGNLTDPIALGRTVWSAQPSADTEFPYTPRILPNLTMAHEFKLRMRITSPGTASAACRLQFSETDNGPWIDLKDGGGGELNIGAAGTLVTDWFKIKTEARDEVILRVMCKGGNSVISPVFYGVSVQLR